MFIRKTTLNDLLRVMEIFDAARAIMRSQGNLTQWPVGSPSEAQVRKDIASGFSYVCCADEDGRACATFAMVEGEDPTYKAIEHGKWRSSVPYATLHRVASDGSERGVAAMVFAFAKEHTDYLRIDTHEDNVSMRRVIEKGGFVHCGAIHIADGSPRLAFDWIRDEGALK